MVAPVPAQIPKLRPLYYAISAPVSAIAFSRLQARNPFASYHIPVTPAVSSNYALF